MNNNTEKVFEKTTEISKKQKGIISCIFSLSMISLFFSKFQMLACFGAVSWGSFASSFAQELVGQLGRKVAAVSTIASKLRSALTYSDVSSLYDLAYTAFDVMLLFTGPVGLWTKVFLSAVKLFPLF